MGVYLKPLIHVTKEIMKVRTNTYKIVEEYD